MLTHILSSRTGVWTTISLLALAAVACGDDEGTSTSQSGGQGGGGAGGTAGSGNVAVGGSGGAGAAGGGPGGQGGDGGGMEFVPSPQTIQYSAVNPLPSGEQLLFNDWASSPNAVWSIAPDGENATEIFRAYRVWAMGVERGTGRIAFASGDPMQEEHYGLTFGDTIQHTFLYDPDTESAEVLAYGNINDECHRFSADGSGVFVCRRYDFMESTSGGNPVSEFSGYRIGRIEIADQSFAWITDESSDFALHPQPLNDGSALLYTLIEVNGTSQHRSIQRLALPNGTPELLRDNASGVVLSPDGTRYLFNDTTDGNKLYQSNIAGDEVVLVADVAASDPTYSPDGLQVAYTLYDNGLNCSHIDVVAADGSLAQNPDRVWECDGTNFITQLAWVDVP